jgi:DNA-binding helix-turn-helix protein
MNILNVYGKNLKKFRTKKNISQEELALLCDLNRNFIGLIERGKRGISLKNIEIISKTLDIEIYKFFLDEEKNI